jgi:DNA sulfur modification protein DndD
MILRAITLEDVGAYAGEQRLEFAPPSDEAPVTLVGGLNGSGKTTLLWGILHALYGPLAGPMVGRKGRYETFLRQWMHGSADRSAITLDVAMPLEGELREISVRRQWQQQGDRIKEDVTVAVDDVFDLALSSAWAETIESVLPRSVARLFFFDGEKVEALADLDRARDTLRVAVGSLLGLDVVDQLMTDLKVLRNRESTAAASPQDQAKLDQVAGEVRRVEEEVANAQQTLGERIAAQSVTAKKLTRIDERFKAAGGPIYEEQAGLLERRRAAEEHLARVRSEAGDLAADWAPMLFVSTQLKALDSAVENERSIQRAAELTDLLRDRDKELLNWAQDLGTDETVRAALRKWLGDDRADRDALGQQPRMLCVEDECALRISHLVYGGLDQLAGARDRVVRALEHANRDLEQIERLQATVPDTLGVEAIIAERDSLELEAAGAAGAREAAEEELARLDRELEKRSARRQRILEQLAEDQGNEDDRTRVIKHAGKAEQTLVRLRDRAVAKHLVRIETAIAEALHELLHKEGLVGGLSIDPATFDLRLHAPDGTPLPADRLSAGERQLVAQAMLWGLSRAAQRPIPAVIDTPLSRLDAGHRGNVVERYLPNAGHQVVVLSTDTELVDEHRDLLGSRVGREYFLDFDDQAGETTIRPGYFALATA